MRHATKRFTILLLIALAIASLTACGDVKEVAGKTLIDIRYTPQRQELVTDYEYKYSWLEGGFVLVPNMHTETLPEKYEVYYRITYTDDSVENVWEEVSRVEYDAAEARLKELQEKS